MNENESIKKSAEEKRVWLKKKLKWLDKEPRAAFFYFFYLALYFEKVRGMCVRRTDEDFANPLSAKALDTESIDLVIVHRREGAVTSSGIAFNTLKNISESEVSEKNSLLLSEPNRQENPEMSEEELLSKFNISTLKNRTANGVSFPHFTENAQGVENITGCVFEILLDLKLKDILGLTNAINTAWAKAKSDFPEAFSWMDIKDEKQCLWVWNTMKKKGVSPPINPLNNYQRWHFICATFDLWKGWTHDQLEELKAGRKKASQQFLNLSASPLTFLEHKKTLLSELEKAWSLKLLRRKEKADTIKLPAKITNSLPDWRVYMGCRQQK